MASATVGGRAHPARSQRSTRPVYASEYYKKGLLAPGVDYDGPHPYLRRTCDRLDPDGYITLPTAPGLGYDIVWDYIRDNAPPLQRHLAGAT